jgi:hypothetical protein
MKYTQSFLHDRMDEWLDDAEYFHSEVLLENPERYRESIFDADWKLSYDDLEHLARENYEYLRKHHKDFYSLEDLECEIRILLNDLFFVKIVNHLAESSALVSLAGNTILEGNAEDCLWKSQKIHLEEAA